MTLDFGQLKVAVCASCYHEHKPGRRRPCFLCLGQRIRGGKYDRWRQLDGYHIPVCMTCGQSDLLKWLQEDARERGYEAIRRTKRVHLEVKDTSPLKERFAEIEAAFQNETKSLK